MAAKFTAQGNLIDRAFYCERERYHYDFEACTIAEVSPASISSQRKTELSTSYC